MDIIRIPHLVESDIYQNIGGIFLVIIGIAYLALSIYFIFNDFKSWTDYEINKKLTITSVGAITLMCIGLIIYHIHKYESNEEYLQYTGRVVDIEDGYIVLEDDQSKKGRRLFIDTTSQDVIRKANKTIDVDDEVILTRHYKYTNEADIGRQPFFNKDNQYNDIVSLKRATK